jgi:HAD superfamily hydrolase (TIGR01509 family)
MLEAVIFDFDGTLFETERSGHRVAFNRAFERLGLPDHWDEDLYGELLAVAGGRERLLHYLRERRPEPVAGDPESVATELHRLKVEEFADLIRCGEIFPRPGVARLLDELEREGIKAAVATTGTRETILDLLANLGSGRQERLAAILTANEAPRKKPDPQVYELALNELGLEADQALAVEDSRNGLLAARAAGLACLVTLSEYSVDESFEEAALVVESLGDSGTAAGVVSDPYQVLRTDREIDVRVLRELHERAVSRLV